MNRCIDFQLKVWLPLAAALLLSACASHLQKPATPAADNTAAAPASQVQVPDKGDPEQRFQAALQLMKDKKPQEAKDAFAALAQDFPQYSGPLTDLGTLQAQGKQRDQAIGSFSRAVAISPKNDFAWGWLGILYREGGDYGHAEQAYLKAIALKPDNPVTHLNLGILYDAYLKRPQDALAQYREYQRIAGKDGKPVVTAWINELQDGLPQAAGTPATAAGQAAPAANTPAPVEHKP